MFGRKKQQQQMPSCEWRCEPCLMGLAFSADGRRLFTSEPGIGERPIRIWDVESREMILEKPCANTLALFRTTFDGLLVVSLDKGDVVRLNAETCDGHSRFQVSHGNRRGTRTSGYWLDSSANRVITGSWDCRARCWNAETGELLSEIKREHNVDTVAILPDGRGLLTDYEGFALWDMEQNLITAHHEHSLGHFAISPDTTRLIALDNQRKVTCWDTADWSHSSFTVKAKKNGVSNFQFSQDGKILAIPSEAGAVFLLNLDDGEVLYQHKRKGLTLNGMAFSNDGSQLACVWRDHSNSIIEVVDVSSIPAIAQRLEAKSGILSDQSTAAVSTRDTLPPASDNVESPNTTATQIRELEALTGHSLPMEYKNFLRNNVESTPNPDGFRFLERQNLVENSVQTFLSLGGAEGESITDAFVEVRNTIEDEYGEDDLDYVLLPIAKDYNFNFLCLVLGGQYDGKVVFFDHEDGYEENLCEKTISDTFGGFMESLHLRPDV